MARKMLNGSEDPNRGKRWNQLNRQTWNRYGKISRNVRESKGRNRRLKKSGANSAGTYAQVRRSNRLRYPENPLLCIAFKDLGHILLIN